MNGLGLSGAPTIYSEPYLAANIEGGEGFNWFYNDSNNDGRGPAWSNSLFEDNAEFGLGMRLALNHQTAYAKDLLVRLREHAGEALVNSLLNTDQTTDSGINIQRELVSALKAKLEGALSNEVSDLLSVADALVKKSVWIVGGDGWAYDIGYGGLDHEVPGV